MTDYEAYASYVSQIAKNEHQIAQTEHHARLAGFHANKHRLAYALLEELGYRWNGRDWIPPDGYHGTV